MKGSKIQTIFVAQQIFVYSECSFHWTIFVDFFLNFIDVP